MASALTMETRAARLNAFLRAAGPSLRRTQHPARGLAKPKDLTQVMARLRPELNRRRSAGDFLNVWVAAGLKRDEVRNAAVLATLLDPARLGALSRALFGALIEEIRPTHPGFSAMDAAGPYTVSTEVCPLGSHDTRIDLLIEGTDFLLGIEVKIDAPEREGQLSDYLVILEQKALLLNKSAAMIFLSPRPSPGMPESVRHITWRDVGRAARKVVRRHRNALEASWLLEQFCDHIAAFG